MTARAPPPAARRRVLVVDDSTFMRIILKRIIEADGAMEVVGEARNGVEAVAMAEALRPDIVTMDVEMPELDGVAATRRIVEGPPPHPAVIMVSVHTREGADATIKALRAGAVDFVSKSSAFAAEDLSHIDAELRQKLRFWMERRPAAPRRPVREAAPAPATPVPGAAATGVPAIVEPRARADLVVVAVSTGGPQTLPLLLDPARPFGAPMVIAQHMPERFTASLASLLRTETGLRVVEGEHRMRLAPGDVVIAPGGRDAVVAAVPGGYELRLTSSDAAVHPCADLLFETAAMIGRQPVAVVLTGMGSDGARGAAAFRRRQLPVLVQDPKSCVVDGMPSAAIAAGAATEILSPRQIGERLARWTGSAYPHRLHNAEGP